METKKVGKEPRMSETVVEMRGITKRFPGVLALDHVDLEVQAGDVHALLGENGAGKTTLMNTLYGLYAPDEGDIYIRGQKATIRSPEDAIALGIGMVHQQLMLISKMTVAENVVLGFPSAKFFFPTKSVTAKIRGLSEEYGLAVDPKAKVRQLSVGERQRVGILKALYRDVEVLILDEPTTMLTSSEVGRLFAVLRRMAEEGRTIIFITHKLKEVFSVADCITVLRDGCVVGTTTPEGTTEQELARMMVGREVLFRLEKKRVERGPVALKVENLHTSDDGGMMALKGVSFVVHGGEILGIAGVAGNGQRELVEVVTGLHRATRGKVIVFGEEVSNLPPGEISKRGVAHIPEDRGVGLLPNMSVAQNLILRDYCHSPFSRGPFLNLDLIRLHAEELVSEHNIVTSGVSTPVRHLSGGNKQRLILAREISRAPRLIIATHPTYGLDVGATENVRQLLLDLRERKVATLLVTEDLEEALAVCDRIAVMFQGMLMGPIEASPAKREEIGLMMGGHQCSCNAVST